MIAPAGTIAHAAATLASDSLVKLWMTAFQGVGSSSSSPPPLISMVTSQLEVPVQAAVVVGAPHRVCGGEQRITLELNAREHKLKPLVIPLG
jgi:hypothetical protein